MSEDSELFQLLKEGIEFPTGQGIKVIRGKTLAKTSAWWKAILLVEVGDKLQLRLYGWQKDKEGVYKVRQKFNISKGYAGKLGDIFAAFENHES